VLGRLESDHHPPIVPVEHLLINCYRLEAVQDFSVYKVRLVSLFSYIGFSRSSFFLPSARSVLSKTSFLTYAKSSALRVASSYTAETGSWPFFISSRLL